MGGVCGVGVVGFADAFQAVGQGAHAEGEAAGGLGCDAAGVEVGGEGVEEGFGAAAGRGWRGRGRPWEGVDADDPDFDRLMGALMTEIRSHVRDEEDNLFPDCGPRPPRTSS